VSGWPCGLPPAGFEPATLGFIPTSAFAAALSVRGLDCIFTLPSWFRWWPYSLCTRLRRKWRVPVSANSAFHHAALRIAITVMSGLRSKDQESEVLLPLVCGEAEQRPGPEAPTRRALLGVRRRGSSTKPVLPSAPTEQAARPISTDWRRRRWVLPSGLPACPPEARRPAAIPRGVSLPVYSLRRRQAHRGLS
jgi:hypothetical protein